MTEEHHDRKPRDVDVAVSVNSGSPTVSVSVRVEYADDVIVEDSDTLRKIATPTGDFLVRKRVFVMVAEHGRVEVTRDVSPEEAAAH